MKKMIKRFFEVVANYKKSYKLYGQWSSQNYVKFLRANDVKVGRNVVFRYPKRTKIDLNRPWLITIGNNCDFNDNFAIMTHDFMTRVFRELYHDFVPSSGAVTIGDNCTFGRNVLICKGVEIGANCCIGAGSIITRSIPANSLAVGIPCKRICSVEEYYTRRKKQMVEEAIQNGIAYYNRYGKLPDIQVFYEEWTLFMNREDVMLHPEMRKHIDFRLKEHFELFFENQNRPFNGFEDFLATIKHRIQES